MNTRFTFLRIAAGLLLLNFAVSESFGQFKSRFPGSGVQSADGCLSCPGSEWNSASAITQKDGQFATTSMTENAFCFQTVCFFTRGLIGSDFGFNIPATSTINGILLRVNRKSDIEHAVRDSAIQLMKGFSFVGNKKKANVFWPTVPKTRSYGGQTDLWGAAWTPADINSPDFGVWLKCYNQSANTPEASVDYMRVTIFYSDSNGMNKQTIRYDFSSEDLQIYPNPAAEMVTLSFSVPEKGMLTLSVFDAIGRRMLTVNEEVKQGSLTKELDMSKFPPGNYFVRCDMKGRVWVGSINKE